MNRTAAMREKFEIFWKNELGQIPNDLLECLPNLKCQAWKNFCAGADIIERACGQEAGPRQRVRLFSDCVRLAASNNQVIGEKNDYYVTLQQLEQLLIHAGERSCGETACPHCQCTCFQCRNCALPSPPTGRTEEK